MLYVRRGILQLSVMVFILVILIILSVKILKDTQLPWDHEIDLQNDREDFRVKSILPESFSVRPKRCGPPEPCPEEHFGFKIVSGAANVVGPKICFNGEVLMGGKTKPWGQGLNIAVVNGLTGELINTGSFDMWSGDIEPLVEYLASIQNGSLVLIATCDDPATRLNSEARTLISQLGSSQISNLGFRDNWIFFGGKGIKNVKPAEKYIKNDKSVNKYDNWPEMIEMEGCVPRKHD